MDSSQMSNILKIDVSDVTSASFSISINDAELVGQIQFLDRNRDSHAVEMHNDNDRIYVRVTPRNDIVNEQFPVVELERNGSTATPIRREEREVEVEAVVESIDDLHIVGGDGPLGAVHLGELGLSPTRALPKKEEDADRGVNMSIAPWTPPEGHEDAVAEPEDSDANDILLTVGEDGLADNLRPGELALSPVKAEPAEEEVVGMSIDYMYAPAVPEVDMFAAEVPHAEVDGVDAAADTPVHTYDTRYQRRQRQQRQQQPYHRGSGSPSRVFSKPYVHDRAAVPAHQRERLQRIARAALKMLEG